MLYEVITGIITGIIAAIYGLRQQVIPALYFILGSIFFMVLTREFLQLAYLKPWFSLADLQVASSYSPLFVFLLFFTGGVVLIGWMLKITWQTYQNREVQ